jgi:hypothetical protein
MTYDPQSIPHTHNDPASQRSVASAPAGNEAMRRPGATVIVNADDWGRNVDTTDLSLDCVLQETVSSVSAMMFMEDSERAALLARQYGVDVGLHLNFTTPFSSRQSASRLIEHQQKLSRFLRSNRYAPVIYHPGLAASFEYVVEAQFEEYERLYGVPADRVDGHHHMHLCANVLFGELIPAGTLVRRNFSFGPGEKSWMNRLYRMWIDRRLKRRHRLVDFLFSLAPVEPVDRLQRICSLARYAVVELETHPVNPEEYRFLTSGEIFQKIPDLRVARGFTACAQGSKFQPDSNLMA